MPNVYMINEDGSTSAMQLVRCKDEDKELQTLLEKNYDLLAGDQISPDDARRWLLVKREMPVPDPSSGEDRWSIDFFFVDQSGMPTFVECKRYYDTRSRREVVGQMLEYAANGPYYWDKETIRQYAETSARESQQTFDASVVQLTNDESISADAFLETIVTNLKEGQVRLIFLLEEAPYELRSIVDFLNKQMERAEVLIIEAKQFLNGKTKIVIPFLFGFTEQARQVKRTVTITRSSQGSRRKWDEASFFEDAELNRGLTTDQLTVIRMLYDFSKSKADGLSLRPDTGPMAGPHLHNIFGRRMGSLPGYRYSERLARGDIVWTPETVADLFTRGPDVVTPGTRMPVQTVGNAEDLAALVRFLEQASP